MFGRLVDWILLFGALIGLAVTGWWSLYAAPNTPQRLQDQLQQDASAVLKADGHDWAQIVMDGQHGRLTGQSPNPEALEAAKVSLGGGNLLLGGITAISSEVTSAPPISPYVFQVDQSGEGAGLVLSGYVPNMSLRDEIRAKAEVLAPGNVSDQLQIGLGEPVGPWKEAVLTGMEQLSALAGGTLRLSDSNIYLSGQSAEGEFEAEALRALVLPAGPFKLYSDVRGPAVWSARHAQGALILTGTVRSEADRTELVELTKAHFEGPVRDEMRIEVTSGEDWLPVLKSLLPNFADFKSGVLAFESADTGFTVKGEAAGSVQSYLEEDLLSGVYPVLLSVKTIETDLPELSGLDFTEDTKTACQSGFEAIMADNSIRFETGQAVISRQSGLTLDKIVSLAARCEGFLIEVGGHTDSSGDRERNIALSKARAASVKAYMVQRGIEARRLDVIGFGPDVPARDNATSTGRAANRRIEFKIVEGD